MRPRFTSIVRSVHVTKGIGQDQGTSHTAGLRFLKKIFLSLSTQAALASCAFISCVNAPKFPAGRCSICQQSNGKGSCNLQAVLTGWAGGGARRPQQSHVCAVSSPSAVLTTPECRRPVWAVFSWNILFLECFFSGTFILDCQDSCAK